MGLRDFEFLDIFSFCRPLPNQGTFWISAERDYECRRRHAGFGLTSSFSSSSKITRSYSFGILLYRPCCSLCRQIPRGSMPELVLCPWLWFVA